MAGPGAWEPVVRIRREGAGAMAEQATTVRGATRRRDRRVIFGVGIGTVLEWYDWGIYAIFAPFFAGQFFDDANPLSAFLSTLAVFAVGFLMRPLGGFFFGWLADRRGRRSAMVLSMVVTALGGLAIAVAPTYAAVGVVASLVLLLARLAQGFGLGGEIGSSYAFLAESSPPARRGLWSSSVYVSVMIGTLFAAVQGALLSGVLTEAQMGAWGWRIPFLIGALLGVYALYLRRNLDETPAYEQEKAAEEGGHERPSLVRGVWEHRASALRVMGLTVGLTVLYYTWAVAAPGYAITVKGLDPTAALWASVVAGLVFIAVLPVAGAVSDRLGRRFNVLVCVVGLALLNFPLNWLVQDKAWQLGLAMSVALVFLAFPTSILPALLPEMFPTYVRASAMAGPYSVAVALFGGTAPYLQTWLASRDAGGLFTGYSIVLLLFTGVVIFFTPETRGRELE